MSIQVKDCKVLLYQFSCDLQHLILNGLHLTHIVRFSSVLLQKVILLIFYSQFSAIVKLSLICICVQLAFASRLMYLLYIVKLRSRSRSRSGEGQEGQIQAKSSSENRKLKDLDLSCTLFLVFTTTTLHTNFFPGFKSDGLRMGR